LHKCCDRSLDLIRELLDSDDNDAETICKELAWPEGPIVSRASL